MSVFDDTQIVVILSFNCISKIYERKFLTTDAKDRKYIDEYYYITLKFRIQSKGYFFVEV
jgi:hypothetical protein